MLDFNFRQVPGYDDYFVNQLGVVYSHKKSKVRELKPWLGTHGYFFVSFSVKGVVKNKSIHRLVASAFIANPQKKPDINHIDGVKTNNNVKNLEWVTKSENLLHSHRVLNQGTNAKKIKCVETGIIYHSAREAERMLGINNANIRSAICKRVPRAGGYHWEYA